MEKESFEDEEVAEQLNQNFVSIKVDREERPDIDNIYMSVCQAFTGHGGWPLTVILTPDKKPFFAGTYFPKHNPYGTAGLMSILNRITNAWESEREDLLNTGEKITRVIQPQEQGAPQTLSESILHDAYRQLRHSFDSVHGGFGQAPKFPIPHNLFFLLRYWYTTGEKHALVMVEKTLEHMYRGGIYDHIGFGFCRYATNRQWLVPHFEKMLYDNALLAIAYLETFQATGNEKYARVAKEIFTYIQRDMTSPEGAFYSAEDADSEGKEGFFYIWNPDQIIAVLGEQDGARFCEQFDITCPGNFEGWNIPHPIAPNPDDLEWVERCRKKLFAAREMRIHPFKDDKILASWNALMAVAYAIGGRVLMHQPYIHASKKAIHFIETHLTRKDGRLLARYRDGEAAIPAFLDDYAFLIWAYLELYQTTYEPAFLQKASDTQDSLNNLFFDSKNYGFFLYGKDAEELIVRPKDAYDGAIPSGNSVTAMNLLRLSRITGNPQMASDFQKQIDAYARMISLAPTSSIYMLTAYLFSVQPSQEIILISDEPEKEVLPFYEVLQENFRPFTTSVRYGREYSPLKHIIPFIDHYSASSGKTQAYVCTNFACKQPVESTEAFRQVLS